MSGEFMTVPELARRLHLPRTRAYELIQGGLIPAVRVGKASLRVPVSYIEKLESQALTGIKERPR